MKHPFALITGFLIITLASTVAAEEKAPKRTPLTLTLSAHIAPAPAQVTARINVERDSRSRSLTVEWWSDDGGAGSHQVNLDGDRAAARQDFAIKRMEPGDYVVSVILVRDDGSVVRKEANLIVVGEGSRFTSSGRGADLMVLEPSSPRGR